jgi:hypothetical protein
VTVPPAGLRAAGSRGGLALPRLAAAALLALPALVAAAAGPPSQKGEQAVDLEVAGPWAHPSGMTFPERAAGFRRVAVTRFPGGEDNFGVSYVLAEGSVTLATVTAYVYPNPGLPLDDHFSQVVADVSDSHAVPPRSRESTAIAQADGMANGRSASWAYREAFGQREQDLESRALLFARGPWFVKYRVTFPASRRGRVEVEIDDLLRALQLPPG